MILLYQALASTLLGPPIFRFLCLLKKLLLLLEHILKILQNFSNVHGTIHNVVEVSA
jgi:hypothetical protein